MPQMSPLNWMMMLNMMMMMTFIIVPVMTHFTFIYKKMTLLEKKSKKFKIMW